MRRARVLLVAVALTGCGTAAAQPRSADGGIARRAVLRLTDLPHGWKRARGTGGGRAACRIARARDLASGTADSATFTRHRQADAENAVYVYRDVAIAQRAFRLLTARSARRCYTSGERRSVAATRGDRVIGALSKTARMPPLGDQRADIRVYVVYLDHGSPLDAVFDLEFVRAGRALAVNFYSALYGPLGALVRRRATRAELRRLAAGLHHRT